MLCPANNKYKTEFQIKKKKTWQNKINELGSLFKFTNLIMQQQQEMTKCNPFK